MLFALGDKHLDLLVEGQLNRDDDLWVEAAVVVVLAHVVQELLGVRVALIPVRAQKRQVIVMDVEVVDPITELQEVITQVKLNSCLGD